MKVLQDTIHSAACIHQHVFLTPSVVFWNSVAVKLLHYYELNNTAVLPLLFSFLYATQFRQHRTTQKKRNIVVKHNKTTTNSKDLITKYINIFIEVQIECFSEMIHTSRQICNFPGLKLLLFRLQHK